VVPGGWSIAVEMQFYLLFPFIIYLVRLHNGTAFCCFLIALSSVVGQFAAQRYLIPQMSASLPQDHAYLADGFFYCWLPRQSVCFGFGLLLYGWTEHKNVPRLGALFLVAACLSSSWGGEVIILFAISFAVLALNVTRPLLGLLGRHSYAIYLAHFAVLSAIAALFPLDLVPMFVLVIGLSLALSYYVTEPLIERPCNRLGHLLASRIGRPKTVATVA